jgi:beta-galactosidase
LRYDGREVISSALHPNYRRASTDSDRGIVSFLNPNPTWAGAGELWKITSVDVSQPQASVIKVDVQGTVQNKTGTIVPSPQRIIYTFFGNGEVKVDSRFAPAAGSPNTPVIGTILGLSGDLDELTWYGRGPGESTADRRFSQEFGVYEGGVDEQLTKYSRPQDSGNKADTRWAALTDDSGFGVMFAGDSPMFVNASRYRPEDLDMKRHWYEVTPRDEVVVRIDQRQEGVQGWNWDVIPRPVKYQLRAQDGPYEHSYRIMPVDRSTSLMDRATTKTALPPDA